MLKIEMEHLFPRFLLNDKNGYALATAIGRGLELFTDTLKEAIHLILDIQTMPEWRLDELAWEYGCLYDYTADIEAKREWISQAESMYSIIGTPDGMYQLLIGYFEDVKILENWTFGGNPFTFRVETTGNTELESWSLQAIEKTKNVRSVLDRLTIYQPVQSNTTIYHVANYISVLETVSGEIRSET